MLFRAALASSPKRIVSFSQTWLHARCLLEDAGTFAFFAQYDRYAASGSPSHCGPS